MAITKKAQNITLWIPIHSRLTGFTRKCLFTSMFIRSGRDTNNGMHTKVLTKLNRKNMNEASWRWWCNKALKLKHKWNEPFVIADVKVNFLVGTEVFCSFFGHFYVFPDYECNCGAKGWFMHKWQPFWGIPVVLVYTEHIYLVIVICFARCRLHLRPICSGAVAGHADQSNSSKRLYDNVIACQEL